MQAKEISNYYRISLKKYNKCAAPYAVTLEICDDYTYEDRHTMHFFKFSEALRFIDEIHDEIAYMCYTYYNYVGIPATAEDIMRLVISHMY